MPPEPVRGAGRPERVVAGDGLRSTFCLVEALRWEGRDAV